MALLPPVIARRRLLATPAGGEEREVVVTIRAPVPEGAQWVCEAGLENLYRDAAQARGVDSLQALQLALDLVRRTLGEVVDGGGRLRWNDGSGEVTPEDLLR